MKTDSPALEILQSSQMLISQWVDVYDTPDLGFPN